MERGWTRESIRRVRNGEGKWLFERKVGDMGE